MEEINKAIEAAGAELRDKHEWSLDDDDSKPVIETLFAQVVLKHVASVAVIDPAAVEIARQAKIAALRAELAALGSKTSEKCDYTAADIDIIAEHSGKTKDREWHSTGCWLRPGDVLAHTHAQAKCIMLK